MVQYKCARLRRRLAKAKHAVVGGPFPVPDEIWDAWLSRQRELFEETVDQDGFYPVTAVSDNPDYQRFCSYDHELAMLGDERDVRFPVAYIDIPYDELEEVLGKPHDSVKCRDFFWTCWHLEYDGRNWTLGTMAESPLHQDSSAMATWSIWGQPTTKSS